jgi:hypothetical protein
MEIDIEKLSRKLVALSKFTKDEFMARCPKIFPECEEELIWWEEWWEKHPDERADAEIEFYEYLKKRDVDYFMFKLQLRLFLEEHSICGIGDFYLHFEGKNVTIRPVVPTGKVFIFKL